MHRLTLAYTYIKTLLLTEHSLVFFAKMYYLSSSSSESEVFMTTKQRDMEQYGYERGFTLHDELTQSMVSSSSESDHPDYLAILLGSSSDSSVSEQPIANVDYSDFAAPLHESR